MGSAFSLRFARTNDIAQTLSELRAQNFKLFALTPDEKAANISDVKLDSSQKRALIFGSERAGLSAQAIASADALVRIEMNPEVDSLNVAAAAAISCYALR